jgi:hypothetical protein
MIKDMSAIIFFDAISTALLIGFLCRNYEPVKTCSPQLYGVGVGFCVYQGSFVIRNILLIILCYFTKKPDTFAYLGRSCGGVFDCFALTGFTIWTTVVLFSV